MQAGVEFDESRSGPLTVTLPISGRLFESATSEPASKLNNKLDTPQLMVHTLGFYWITTGEAFYCAWYYTAVLAILKSSLSLISNYYVISLFNY